MHRDYTERRIVFVANALSARPHGQFHVVGERHRQIPRRRRAHAVEVVRAVVRIVGDDRGARPQMRFQQREDVGIQGLGAVQQDEVDRIRQVAGERPQRIARADLDEIEQAGCRQVGARPLDFRFFEFAGGQAPAAVVAQGGGQVNRFWRRKGRSASRRRAWRTRRG
jgi:hypothetical protein